MNAKLVLINDTSRFCTGYSNRFSMSHYSHL